MTPGEGAFCGMQRPGSRRLGRVGTAGLMGNGMLARLNDLPGAV
ncbi:MAG TPA: hypothetical protein PKV33_07540 [Methanothrix sp.]|nr:hypothetical protein [Methanothrix sp.]